MIIPKSNNDPYGLEFDRCLSLARYVYPSPDNPHAQEIVAHAKQIYEAELIERSLCAMDKSFVPCTYKTIYENFGLQSPLLTKQKPYVMTKNRETVKHVRTIFEYPYEFLDILHVPTKSIIECKVAVSENSLARHRKKILDKWRTRRGPDYNDYYLMSMDKGNAFEIIDFVKIVAGKFVREDFSILSK